MNQSPDDKPVTSTDPPAPPAPPGGVVRFWVTVSGVGGFLPAPPSDEAPDGGELPETD